MIEVYDYYQEENKTLKERFTLASERIREIQNATELCAPYALYATKVAAFLSQITDTWNCVANGSVYQMPLEQLQQLNHSLYADILPDHYAESYANPDYACNVFGLEMGQLLCALYAEMRGCIAYVFEQHLQYVTMAMELFLEVYSILEQEDPSAEEVRHALYYYCFDYADITIADRNCFTFRTLPISSYSRSPSSAAVSKINSPSSSNFKVSVPPTSSVYNTHISFSSSWIPCGNF